MRRFCVLLSLASFGYGATWHASEPEDVPEWNFDEATYVGELSYETELPEGRGNMTWNDGRSIAGEWINGQPVEAEIHILPRDIYKYTLLKLIQIYAN